MLPQNTNTKKHSGAGFRVAKIRREYDETVSLTWR